MAEFSADADKLARHEVITASAAGAPGPERQEKAWMRLWQEDPCSRR